MILLFLQLLFVLVFGGSGMFLQQAAVSDPVQIGDQQVRILNLNQQHPTMPDDVISKAEPIVLSEDEIAEVISAARDEGMVMPETLCLVPYTYLGDRQVYVGTECDERAMILVMDGGPSIWSGVYNLDEDTWESLIVNGDA